MRMFWRVFGPAWQRDEIDYQFGLMKQAGIGGVMTSFFYPVAMDDPAAGVNNQQLGSPEFLKTFSFAALRAKDLGLRFSVFGGSGWPFGGPTVGTRDAAQRIRRVVARLGDAGRGLTLPSLADGEQIVAAFDGARDMLPTLPAGHALSRAKIGRDGSGTGDLQVFISGPTGMKVKRPALGGEGLVVDHYSRNAALRYLESAVAPMLNAAPGMLDTVFCDSLEVYNANWTHDYPEQFRKRRGYDIIHRLPELFDGKCAASPDLRFDFWRTLAELTEERFTKTTGDWARSHGTKLEMEAYGTPPNPLTAARYIDVPAGEQYEWQGFSMSRLAASGAHLAGRRIISAEAWTWLGIPNRLADTLRDMKLASDIHFLAGCNDLIGVDFPYSPRSVPPPGWQPYYGPTMNQNNPQWPYFHALVEYVNRCQWMLRQGRPVADVAIYLPVEDSFAHGPVEQMLLDFHLRDHFVTGEKTGEFGLAASMKHRSDLINTLLTNGFNYDGIDFWSINRFAKVKNGKLICGDGEYSIVILPGLEGIDAQALAKLEEFVKQGGTLIIAGKLPRRAYGAGASGALDRARLISILSRLESGLEPIMEGVGDVRWAKQGKGDVYVLANPHDTLSSVISRAGPTGGVGESPAGQTVHRSTPTADIYFITNLEKDNQRLLPRGVIGDYTVFNPMTGSIIRHATGDVELRPLESTFVVVRKGKKASPKVRGNIQQFLGRKRMFAVDWHVAFEGPDAPKPRDLSDLVSWTTWPEAKFFSGQGIYTSSFEWKDAIPKSCRLRFESVREAGEVWINARSAGVVWMPPYEVQIAPLLKPGTNTIRVTVGNLTVNRFLGLPDEDLRPLRAAYRNRFPDPQEKRVMKEPAPSGLIGKVWLVTEDL